MLVYISTYIIVVLIAVLISRSSDFNLVENNGRYTHGFYTKALYILASLVMIFVAGCRFRVGADYGVYYADYKLYAEGAFDSLLRLSEPGIRYLNRIAIFIKDDPASCIFLCAAVTTILALNVYYKYSNNLSLCLVFYVFVIWHTSFNGIRQALAVAFFFCAYPTLKNKKLIEFLAISFVAFLFHKSVVPFVIIYFLVNRRVNTINLILLLSGTLILLYSYMRIFSVMGSLMDKEDYFLNYSSGSMNYLSRSVNTLRVGFEMFPAVFFLIKYPELSDGEERNRVDLHINLLMIHAAVALATSGSAYMARMSLYTMPFAVMSISYLISCLKKNRGFYTLLFIAMFAFFGIYEVGHSARLIPFHWIWQR